MVRTEQHIIEYSVLYYIPEEAQSQADIQEVNQNSHLSQLMTIYILKAWNRVDYLNVSGSKNKHSLVSVGKNVTQHVPLASHIALQRCFLVSSSQHFVFVLTFFFFLLQQFLSFLELNSCFLASPNFVSSQFLPLFLKLSSMMVNLLSQCLGLQNYPKDCIQPTDAEHLTKQSIYATVLFLTFLLCFKTRSALVLRH